MTFQRQVYSEPARTAEEANRRNADNGGTRMQNPQNASPWKLGNTQPTNFGVGGRLGFGFSVQDQWGAPLLTISYATEEEAKEAEIIIRKAIEKAVDITKP